MEQVFQTTKTNRNDQHFKTNQDTESKQGRRVPACVCAGGEREPVGAERPEKKLKPRLSPSQGARALVV